MALTNLAIDNAKPAAKAFKLADGGGLFLVVQPNGSKFWRLRYFFLGKERTLSIGPYPIVSLADARQKREQAKRQIIAGTDPSVQKKLDRIAAEATSHNTFGVIAGEYIERLEANGAAQSTLKKNRWTTYGHRDVLVRGHVHDVVISCGADVIARHVTSPREMAIGFACDPSGYAA